MKIAINSCYGGFSLSDAAIRRCAEIKGVTLYAEEEFGYTSYYTVPKHEREDQTHFDSWTLEERAASNTRARAQSFDIYAGRNDPALIQVIEEMGAAANGECAKLKIVEIPDGVEWTIQEYDGHEHVAEVHRTWS